MIALVVELVVVFVVVVGFVGLVVVDLVDVGLAETFYCHLLSDM